MNKAYSAGTSGSRSSVERFEDEGTASLSKGGSVTRVRKSKTKEFHGNKRRANSPYRATVGGATIKSDTWKAEEKAEVSKHKDDPPPEFKDTDFVAVDNRREEDRKPKAWNRLKYHVNVEQQMPDHIDVENIQASKSDPSKQHAMMRGAAIKFNEIIQEEQYDLSDDVYTMLFMTPSSSGAFWFSFSVFLIKIGLYAFLATEIYREPFFFEPKNELVLMAQFFILPVTIAIQDDLMTGIVMIANVRWHEEVLLQYPGATYWKWGLSLSCRMVDGVTSLAVNYILLLQAPEVSLHKQINHSRTFKY